MPQVGTYVIACEDPGSRNISYEWTGASRRKRKEGQGFLLYICCQLQSSFFASFPSFGRQNIVAACGHQSYILLYCTGRRTSSILRRSEAMATITNCQLYSLLPSHHYYIYLNAFGSSFELRSFWGVRNFHETPRNLLLALLWNKNHASRE